MKSGLSIGKQNAVAGWILRATLILSIVSFAGVAEASSCSRQIARSELLIQTRGESTRGVTLSNLSTSEIGKCDKHQTGIDQLLSNLRYSAGIKVKIRFSILRRFPDPAKTGVCLFLYSTGDDDHAAGFPNPTVTLR